MPTTEPKYDHVRAGRVVSAFVLLFFLVSAAASSEPASDSTGVVTGVVATRADGRPLPLSVLFVEGTRHGAYATEDGSFCIGEVPPGTYTIRVARVGYDPQRSNIAVRMGESTSVAFALKESPDYTLHRGALVMKPEVLRKIEEYRPPCWNGPRQYAGTVVEVERGVGQVKLQVRSDDGRSYRHWLVSTKYGDGLVIVTSSEDADHMYATASVLARGQRVQIDRSWWGVRSLIVVAE